MISWGLAWEISYLYYFIVSLGDHDILTTWCLIIMLHYIEGILPKWPYLPCVSMAGRALLAGYPRYQCCDKGLPVTSQCTVCFFIYLQWIFATNIAYLSVFLISCNCAKWSDNAVHFTYSSNRVRWVDHDVWHWWWCCYWPVIVLLFIIWLTYPDVIIIIYEYKSTFQWVINDSFKSSRSGQVQM